MFTVRNPLAQFLYDRAPNPDLIPEKLSRLEPLFRAILAKDDRLAAAGEINIVDACTAISAALDVPEQRVVLVSRSRPFDRPDWMTDESVRQILGCALSHNIGQTFSQAFHEHWRKILPLADDSEIWNTLWKTLRGDCGVLHDCYTALGSGLGGALGGSVRSSVGRAITMYLALSLADDDDWSIVLGPLIDLLAKARPIGEMKDRPGTWLVLVE